eukprot:TRINITY_DN7732_c0_g1_i1.p2 TRINITY_DN7732_c0_g1~~TRINITY_DN7732_c0_g1_i1.p2  ORF type:complete len:170 (-),score=28.34 TRINITY_DN7732_c0_g1_i1:96-605(-)
MSKGQPDASNLYQPQPQPGGYDAVPLMQDTQATQAPIYTATPPPPTYTQSNPYHNQPPTVYQQTQQHQQQQQQQHYIPPAVTSTVRPAQVVYSFGRVPAQHTCQHCHNTVITKIRYTPGLAVIAIAGIICLFGGFFGCCLIPFCIAELKDVEHTCPSCHRIVGSYKPLK